MQILDEGNVQMNCTNISLIFFLKITKEWLSQIITRGNSLHSLGAACWNGLSP